MVDPVIKDRLPSVESNASISRSSLSSDPSPRAAHSHVSTQLPLEDTSKADRVAVAGTNDGSLDWREAHENWTSSTGVTLSPSAFGHRIMAVGGGKLVKGTASADKQPVASNPSQAPVVSMKQPTALSQAGEKVDAGVELTRQQSAQSDRESPVPRPPSNHAAQVSAHPNSARPAPLSRPLSNRSHRGRGRPSPLAYSTSFNPELTFHPPPSQSPSVVPQRAGNHGFGFPPPPPIELYPVAQHQPQYPPMPTMYEYRQDIDALRAQFTDLQTTISQLSRKVDDLSRSRATANGHEEIEQSRDEAMDALAETIAEVSTKAAKVDSVSIQVETLKRKVKRLEEANANVQATPSKDRGASVLAMNGTPSTQTLDYPSNGFTPTNALKRGPSNDLNCVKKKTPRIDSTEFRPENFRSVGDSQPATQPGTPSFGPETTASESQRPMMAIRGGHYASMPRKRGRPSKYDAMPLEVEDPESPQWERDSWMVDQGDEGAYYQPPDSGDVRGGGLHSSVIRRGTGGELIRTRRKPVRNAEGLLLRADGTIDRRSFTSKANLRKIHDARSSQGEGRRSLRESPTQSQDNSKSKIPLASGNPNKTQDHDKVMKLMFPHGIAADTHYLDEAEQLFSNDSSERPKMLPRHEMLREDANTGSSPVKMSDGSGIPHHQDGATDTSYVSSTEQPASESPKPPSTHSVISELGLSPYSPPPPAEPRKIEESEASFMPSTEPTTTATGFSGTENAAANGFVIPDSSSTGVSKVSSVSAPGTAATEKTNVHVPESQESYQPSMDTHM